MIRRALLKALRTLLPETRLGDFIYSYLLFVTLHRRLPSKDSGLWNDQLFYFKVSKLMEDPTRGFVSDKAHVKTYIKGVVGDRYNIPSLAVLSSMDEVRKLDFPKRCVIKPTHLTSEVILRTQGEAIDYALIEKWFATSYYRRSRERNYKAVLPRLIVEPYVFGKVDPDDLKVFCNNGRAALIQVDSGRKPHHQRTHYDPQWKRLPFNAVNATVDSDGGLALPSKKKPKNLKEMIRVAERISQNFEAFVRVDFYSNGKELKIGEITNCPGGAINRFYPEGAERLVAEICR